MNFDDFVTLCSKARFINIVIGDEDYLVVPDIVSSTESQGCFHHLDRTEGFDFLIRKADVTEARAHGNGYKVTVLVPEDEDGADGQKVVHEEAAYVSREATLYFLKLVELRPEAVLKTGA